jgi:hypothetical protein
VKNASFFALALLLLTVPVARAQNHGEVGVFGDYFRFSQAKANFSGLGGRFSLNVSPHVQLEAEMNYDFTQTFVEGFTNPTDGSITFQSSNLRVLHGLFGPKLQTSGGPVRLFFTVKGGFMDFRFDPRPATFATFSSTVEDLRLSNVKGVLYPGGGVEAYLGPIGFRLDVGDEIYFSGGAHQGLRVTFGPSIRF